MRTPSTLVTLILGLAFVFLTPIAKADCPHNDKFDHRHCGGGEPLPPGVTLGDLACSTDEIAKFNGSDWVCDVDRRVKFVFASSTISDGDLGGLGGADTECNALAANAGLSGEFVAWLSTNSLNAVDRMAGSVGPWLNTAGQMVASAIFETSHPPVCDGSNMLIYRSSLRVVTV